MSGLIILFILFSSLSLISLSSYAVKMLKSGPAGGGGRIRENEQPNASPSRQLEHGDSSPSVIRPETQTDRVTSQPATMFYPELSPAMRWHLDHNQKMYNMQMFSHQFSDKFQIVSKFCPFHEKKTTSSLVQRCNQTYIGIWFVQYNGQVGLHPR